MGERAMSKLCKNWKIQRQTQQSFPITRGIKWKFSEDKEMVTKYYETSLAIKHMQVKMKFTLSFLP